MSSPPLGLGRARRIVLAGCAVAVALGLLPLPATASGSGDTYRDAASGTHAPAIAALKAAGILEGTDCGRNRFCPSTPLQRRVMAVWIARAVDSQEPTTTTAVPSFADVDNKVWWAPHVERLARLRVTFGCSINPPRYCPEEPVTRAEMSSFLARAFGLEASGRAGFADIAGNTHASSIDALATAEITAGCATGPIRYCPGSQVTRAQMATFLARALKLVDLPQASALLPVGSALDGTELDGLKHIVYAQGGQHMWLVQADGTLFDSYPVSGRANLPPPGRYRVFSKSPHTRAFYGGITMDHMVRFLQRPGKAAIGFHSIPVYPNGTPMQTEAELGQFRSGGCVRQRNDKAEQLYEWAPIGTPVVVLA